MKKTVVLYGLAIACGALALRWLEYQHAARLFATEIYIALIALAFTLLGAWLGHRLTRRQPPIPFARNEQALACLGISEREYDVLSLLAAGHSNREIAARLFVSENTVKTHLARLYVKLEVKRRTQAIERAKALQLLP